MVWDLMFSIVFGASASKFRVPRYLKNSTGPYILNVFGRKCKGPEFTEPSIEMVSDLMFSNAFVAFASNFRVPRKSKNACGPSIIIE